MKTLDWIKYFGEQRARHGKVVFSAPELANVARTTLHCVNTELGRLIQRGVVHRYAQGRYGPVEGVRPEDVVAAVDPGAYITSLYALFHHHLVTQVPVEVVCFTHRRHNRKPNRATEAGTLKFICVPADIYAPPAGSVIATPEQALCDFAWLSLRDGVEPKALVTFRNLHRISPKRLKLALRRYPGAVGEAVLGILKNFASEGPRAVRRSRRHQCQSS